MPGALRSKLNITFARIATLPESMYAGSRCWRYKKKALRPNRGQLPSNSVRLTLPV